MSLLQDTPGINTSRGLDGSWTVQIPFTQYAKHPVKWIKTVPDIMRDRTLTYVRWYDDLGYVAEGELFMEMFEDRYFDIAKFLDELWGTCLDRVGWCDWTWSE